ncbi:MAG: endonuclease/exonuclease/phosphatase family protein [Candidatus Obscuribacterales bacterium]|nr:endonuclease/exonuclease/phosphatase family protein [Candidatus Obscuribacterales bacterium]
MPKTIYWLDNLSQLRIVYEILSLVFLAAAFFFRQRKLLLLSLLSLLVNSFAMLPYLLPQSNPEGKSISLLTMNIWGGKNRKLSETVALIRALDPDLVCINEINKPWKRALKKLLPDYPFRVDDPNSDDAAIFSKLPIQQLIPKENPWLKRFGVSATFKIGKQDILIIAVHPPAPSTYKKWMTRNLEYQQLINDVHSARMPVIIIGDLNSTPWSPYFRELLEKTGLQDSAIGKGIQPSYSTQYFLPLVPIDHCLSSHNLVTTKRILGPALGSDHLPVYLELQLRN